MLPLQMSYEVLDFGRHINPEALRSTLQEKVNNSPPGIETIVLGYGLCSMAVVGLKANGHTLIVPRVDNCIGILLGSQDVYRKQVYDYPGTYYLSRGWIKAGNTLLDEYEALAERYGWEKSRLVFSRILKHYSRVAFINTGSDGRECYQTHARRMAAQFGLRYGEITCSDALFGKMLHGPWDKGFVIATPGEIISYLDFKRF